MDRVSVEDLSSVGVWWQGKREVHLLFMWLLALDICASVVISEQIVRDREWRVLRPHVTPGMPSLVPVLLTFSAHRQHGYGLKVSKNDLPAPFPGQEPHRHTVEAGH